MGFVVDGSVVGVVWAGLLDTSFMFDVFVPVGTFASADLVDEVSGFDSVGSGDASGFFGGFRFVVVVSG